MVFKRLTTYVIAVAVAGVLATPAAAAVRFGDTPLGGQNRNAASMVTRDASAPEGSIILAQTIPGREDHADPEYVYPHERGGLRGSNRRYRPPVYPDRWDYRDRRDRRIYRAPRYYRPAPPPVVNRGVLQPFTPAWYAYCAAKYRSFNPRTGTYTTYSGRQRFCR